MRIRDRRSSYEMVGRVVFFSRMLDKIRLHAESCLPADYNRSVGLDERTCRLLHIDYEKLVSRVLQGGTDEEILEWCCQQGRRPSKEEIFVWNAFMTKAGGMTFRSGLPSKSGHVAGSSATTFRPHLTFTLPMKQNPKLSNQSLELTTGRE